MTTLADRPLRIGNYHPTNGHVLMAIMMFVIFVIWGLDNKHTEDMRTAMEVHQNVLAKTQPMASQSHNLRFSSTISQIGGKCVELIELYEAKVVPYIVEYPIFQNDSTFQIKDCS